MPDPVQARAEFDAQLVAVPASVTDPENFELRQALGIPT